MAKFLIMHGPNLGLLGRREPERYGRTSLAALDAELAAYAEAEGHSCESFQSDAEHELIARVHATADDGTAAIVINPAAFTHTSIALRDALLAVELPVYEVHITNPAAREPFRRTSYFTDIAIGSVSGLGVKGYGYALAAAIERRSADDGQDLRTRGT